MRMGRPFWWLVCCAISAAGCGDGGASGDDVTPTDVAQDAVDAAADDGEGDVPGRSDIIDVAGCTDGDTRCAGDDLAVEVCAEGAWATRTNCLAEHGQVCEDGACVAPWRIAAAPVDSCAEDPNATALGLAAKAARYQRLGEALHFHPRHKRALPVTLKDGVDLDSATWEDVERWHTGENDGLWTGLYIASQVFRVAVTGDDGALAHLRELLDGMRIGMEVTGVPGIFTREYITPGIDGMACPSDPLRYVPDVEKDDNQWVRVAAGGVVETYDADAGEFVASEHRVSEEFVGYCWLDNVSQDEYAGHMLALSLVELLVEDEAARAVARDLLEKVGAHLLDNHMAFVDWDGRQVEHGKFWPFAFDNFPGYNAVLGMSYIKAAAVASGRADLQAHYDDCLLQRSGPRDCIEQPFARPEPYTDVLNQMGLYPDTAGCKANWNNFGMAWTAMFTLIWMERDPALRAQLQQTFTDQFWRRGSARDMEGQHNTAWAMMYAAMMAAGPGRDERAADAIEDALCGLRQFPESKAGVSQSLGEDELPTDEACESRFAGRFLTTDPAPVWRRCMRNFLWWANPYRHQQCEPNPRFVDPPADYLLPYWMARYFGWLGEAD